MADSNDWSRKVFRVSGLPSTLTTFDAAARVLSESLGNFPRHSIKVFSIATTLKYWEEPRSKVATVMFDGIPELLQNAGEKAEYSLPCIKGGTLVLDSHFLGMTPLNEVDPILHSADCIAIPGLASHPFGSWQPRGEDKTFMWIRDELPHHLPTTRAVVYGYRAKLQDSPSFQVISDLAQALINLLQAYGWCSPTAKPTAFLAHSLGGLVLKEAITQLANSPNDLYQALLARVRGAVFFGVPNLGMEQAHFRTIVQSNPNEALIDDLARNSNYTRRLNETFLGFSFNSRIRCYWAFETSESHTSVRLPDGSVDRNGPLSILVSRESATCRYIETDASVTFPIDSTHSEMVKFGRDSHYCHIVVSKLLHIYQQAEPDSPEGAFGHGNNHPQLQDARAETAKPAKVRKKFSLEDTLTYLRAPYLGSRKKEIADRFENTFEWVYDHAAFKQWLQHGDGIFWIRGKPGSGKSTLMKFICQDARTDTLLRTWRRGGMQVRADFFFHFRGTAVQKSFEGVLRSLLAQILSKNRSLYSLLDSKAYYRDERGDHSGEMLQLSSLKQSLRDVLNQSISPMDLVLFFDALDEFDGHPEVIGRFLEELARPDPGSRTRVKVLFSSRLWDSFIEQFHACPGFDIHALTQEDMRSYCEGRLKAHGLGKHHMIDLVSDIVEKSRGVFLWVELVIRDFCDTPALLDGKSYAELQEQLKSAPTELDDYYALIVSRIPQELRWETYALMEVIVRTDQTKVKVASYIQAVVECSGCQTYQACQEKLLNFTRLKGRDLEEYLRKSFASCSGGLAEVIGTYGGLKAELMHQTVHEFVTSLRFKNLVLGERAKTVVENGHSFYLKFLMSLRGTGSYAHIITDGSEKYNPGPVGGDWRNMGRYAKKAELTTGNSQKIFLDSTPSSAISGITLTRRNYYIELSSILQFAVTFSLHLYIRDLMSLSPASIRDCRQPLLDHLMEVNGDSHDEARMAKALVDSGYHSQGLSGILDRVVKYLALNDNNRPAIDLAFSLLKAGEYMHNVEIDRSNHITLLHTAHPRIIGRLLENGANPNLEDRWRRTPLDYAIDIYDRFGALPGKKESRTLDLESILPLRLQACRLLIDKGGKFHRMKSEWAAGSIATMKSIGLETTFLEQHLLRNRGRIFALH